MTTITALPTPPSRSDPANFAARADAFLAALPTFGSETNAVAGEVNANASTASSAAGTATTKAAEAAASADSAASAAGASAWVSGTTYAAGACVYSPIDYQTYRRKSAGAGTTDPSADATNWQKISVGVEILTDPIITGTILEDIYTITDGAAFEIDPGNGSVQLITLGANRTPKATNFANGEAVTMMILDGTTYTLTWTDTSFGGSGVVWIGGTAPTLDTTKYTVIELWKVGGQVYGAYVGAA